MDNFVEQYESDEIHINPYVNMPPVKLIDFLLWLYYYEPEISFTIPLSTNAGYIHTLEINNYQHEDELKDKRVINFNIDHTTLWFQLLSNDDVRNELEIFINTKEIAYVDPIYDEIEEYINAPRNWPGGSTQRLIGNLKDKNLCRELIKDYERFYNDDMSFLIDIKDCLSKGTIIKLTSLQKIFDNDHISQVKLFKKNVQKLNTIINKIWEDIDKLGGEEGGFKRPPLPDYENLFPLFLLESGGLITLQIPYDVKYLSGYTKNPITFIDDTTFGYIMTQKNDMIEYVENSVNDALFFHNYVLNLLNVHIKYYINDTQRGFKLFINMELYTNEDYYATIGYYRTRLDNLCLQSSRYNEDELYIWAHELDIDTDNLSHDEVCMEIKNWINMLRYTDLDF